MPMYLYGLLRKDVSPEAERHNDEWLGPNTLGIEVTSDYLARRCGLGNIDPQHQVNGGSSAIEEALISPLPKAGSRMVTIRPDKDSIGAMAILTLRAEGRGNNIDRLMVSWIGALDRYGYGNALEAVPDLASCFEDNKAADALNVICLSKELWPTMSEKVLQAGRVLCGEMSREELERVQSIKTLRKMETKKFSVELYGEIAFVHVRGELEAARNWANRRFPVAVIYDDCHQSHGGVMAKWSVIRQPLCFNRRAFETAINAVEAEARGMTPEELNATGFSWGGTLNIVSSPTGVGRGSMLSREAILALVRTHLESSVVS